MSTDSQQATNRASGQVPAAVIETYELTQRFGDVIAVSFNVRVGEIFGRIGPNGAGKSALIKNADKDGISSGHTTQARGTL
jgi:ABC-type branched-subunit amino acid transport system ATPase component